MRSERSVRTMWLRVMTLNMRKHPSVGNREIRTHHHGESLRSVITESPAHCIRASSQRLEKCKLMVLEGRRCGASTRSAQSQICSYMLAAFN